ncbi:hypothetical protein N9V96_00380 [Polaribacter sp.]|nr:hypothetical protein [Polaribacter sp.]
MKKLTILFLFLCTTVAIAQEKVKLRLKYNKGDVYEIKIKMNQSMGAVASTTSTMLMEQVITNTSKEFFEATTNFTNVVMQVEQGGTLQTYDSSKPVDENNAFSKQMQSTLDPILNATMTTKGNYRGEIVEFNVEPNIPGVEKMTNSSNNVVYPEESIMVGSKWSMTKEESGISMNFDYVVKEIRKNIVVLDVSGKISGIASGTISGVLNVNKSNGIPSESTIKMTMDIGPQKMVMDINALMTKK